MQESKSVMGILCSTYDSFFDAEKKIADFILGHKEEVIDMTVAELAQASKTSDATVSRFCRRCGFKGFHHLKITLAREVTEDSQKSAQVGNDINRGDIRQSLQNILANKVAELTQTVSMIDEKTLDQVLTLVLSARMVQLVAVGNTIPVALDGAFKLNQLGILATAGTIWETNTAVAYNLGKEDVLIVISNSGFSNRLITLMEGAAENGVKIVAITNNPQSSVAKAAHYHITTATREKLLLGDFCFSRVSATAVIEIIYLFLAMSKPDSYDHIRRHEIAISDDKI